MASLELSREEMSLAVQVMESAYGDLREEIYKTEDHSYKRQLKEREVLFEAVLRKLSVASAAG